MRPQPFLKNYQAEKDFVVLPGAMLVENLLYCRRAQVVIYLAFGIQKNPFHFLLRAAAKPIINNIYSKSPLLSFQYRCWKHFFAHLAMQPFSRAISNFQV